MDGLMQSPWHPLGRGGVEGSVGTVGTPGSCGGGGESARSWGHCSKEKSLLSNWESALGTLVACCYTDYPFQTHYIFLLVVPGIEPGPPDL
jgi:hypothetical protein